MEVTLERIYEELLDLKKEVEVIKEAIFLEEVKPSEDEVRAIEEYEGRKKSGKVEWVALEGDE